MKLWLFSLLFILPSAFADGLNLETDCVWSKGTISCLNGQKIYTYWESKKNYNGQDATFVPVPIIPMLKFQGCYVGENESAILCTKHNRIFDTDYRYNLVTIGVLPEVKVSQSASDTTNNTSRSKVTKKGRGVAGFFDEPVVVPTSDTIKVVPQ